MNFIKLRGYRKDSDRHYLIRPSDIESAVDIADGAKIRFFNGREELFVSNTVEDIYTLIQEDRLSRRRSFLKSSEDVPAA